MRYAIMGLLSFLTACSATSTTKQSENLANGERWATEVFLTNQCVLAEASQAPALPFIAGIGAAVIPALIDVSLSAFSQALQNAAKEKTTTYAAHRAVSLFKRSETPDPDRNRLPSSALEIDDRFRCILVIAGRFNSSKDTLDYNDSDLAIGSNPIPADLKTTSIEDLTEYLKNVGTGLVGAPDLVYEAKIIPLQNREAFIVSSNFLYVGSFQGSGGAAKRALAITIAVDAPAAAKGASTLRAIPMIFGEVEAGTRLADDQFGQGERSILIQGIEASKSAKEVFEPIASVETQHSVALAELKQAKATKPKNQEEKDAQQKKIRDLTARLASLATRHADLAAIIHDGVRV
jgi:hypothetical protein